MTDSSPGHLYDAAVVRLAKTWPFTARKTRGGHPTRTCGLRLHVPVYGEDAMKAAPVAISQSPTIFRRIDLENQGESLPGAGRVTAEFCVTPDGTVDRVKIIGSRPEAKFDLVARMVLAAWQYWPRMINGHLVETCQLTATIHFDSTDNKLLWAYPARR